jgi:hypothetical protein
LNARERLDYIFGDHPTDYIPNKFGWLDTVLLSDIRTLISGGKRLKNTKSRTLIGSYGAGNVTIPILLCVGIELAAALYVGKTRYNVGSNYDATANVEVFIKMLFPHHAKELPRILWNGVRNGLDHTFFPKFLKANRIRIQFMFYTESMNVKSHLVKSRNVIKININCIEFYQVFKQVLKDYKSQVQSRKTLQINFMKAWKSIVKFHAMNAPMLQDFNYMSTQLRPTNRINLFL